MLCGRSDDYGNFQEGLQFLAYQEVAPLRPQESTEKHYRNLIPGVNQVVMMVTIDFVNRMSAISCSLQVFGDREVAGGIGTW